MSKTQAFEFTLVLNGVNDETKHLEDVLFEAGCDDALINYRNGTVYLDFLRESTSLEKAVISAIKAVEGAGVSAKVISILPDDLVTESDIANRLNKSRQSISLWVKKSRRQQLPFPHPVFKLTDKSPMWRWYEVAKWLYEQQVIKDSKIVENAKFIENLNAVLTEREPAIHRYRCTILEKLKHNNASL